jgi:hypothetical protein
MYLQSDVEEATDWSESTPIARSLGGVDTLRVTEQVEGLVALQTYSHLHRTQLCEHLGIPHPDVRFRPPEMVTSETLLLSADWASPSSELLTLRSLHDAPLDGVVPEVLTWFCVHFLQFHGLDELHK